MFNYASPTLPSKYLSNLCLGNGKNMESEEGRGGSVSISVLLVLINTKPVPLEVEHECQTNARNDKRGWRLDWWLRADTN